jgi:hypothetical protein
MTNCAESGLGLDCGCDRIGHTVRDLPRKKHVWSCGSPRQCSERIHGSDQSLNDCIRAEIPLSCGSNGWAVESLGSGEGVKVDRQRKLVCVVLDVLPTGRQPIDNESGHTVTDNAGQAFADISLQKCRKGIPALWADQRRLLLPTASSDLSTSQDLLRRSHSRLP